jgi:thiamine pyrophosphate-dependent acetolactate synthase large subunit-like protein
VLNLIHLAGTESAPDLIILLGVRTGMFMGGRSGGILPNTGCKIIQVDTDGGEIGRSLPVDLGIVSDVASAIGAFHDAISPKPFKVSQEWTSLATGLKKTPNAHDKDEPLSPDGRQNPYLAIKELLSSLEPGSIVNIDGGECGSWTIDLLESARPHISFFAAGYLGMLSSGFGYSLGCAIADPSRQVINIQGDGSVGFHLQELDTYARFKLNILTVVVNNYVWGMSKHGQDIIYTDATPARPVSSLSPSTAYHTIADGFGNASAKVEQLGKIGDTVRRLSAQDGPALINLIVSDSPAHEGVHAVIDPTDDPSIIVVPYYDNIPRPFFKSIGEHKTNGSAK